MAYTQILDSCRSVFEKLKQIRDEPNITNKEAEAKKSVEDIVKLSQNIEALYKGSEPEKSPEKAPEPGKNGPIKGPETGKKGPETEQTGTQSEPKGTLPGQTGPKSNQTGTEPGEKGTEKTGTPLKSDKVKDFKTKIIEYINQITNEFLDIPTDETIKTTDFEQKKCNDDTLYCKIKNAVIILNDRTNHLKKINEIEILDGDTLDVFKTKSIQIKELLDGNPVKYSTDYKDLMKQLYDKILKLSDIFIKLTLFDRELKKFIDNYKTDNIVEENEIISQFKQDKQGKKAYYLKDLSEAITNTYFILNKSILYFKFCLETTNILLIRQYNFFRNYNKIAKKHSITDTLNFEGETVIKDDIIKQKIFEELKFYKDIFINEKKIDDIPPIKDTIDKKEKLFFKENRTSIFDEIKNSQIIDPFFALYNQLLNRINIKIGDIKTLPITKFEFNTFDEIMPEDSVISKISKILLYNYVKSNILFERVNTNGIIDYTKFISGTKDKNDRPAEVDEMFGRIFIINQELYAYNELKKKIQLTDKFNNFIFNVGRIIDDFIIKNAKRKGSETSGPEYKNNFKGGYTRSSFKSIKNFKKTRKFRKSLTR
jgi:hypothetical protein